MIFSKNVLIAAIAMLAAGAASASNAVNIKFDSDGLGLVLSTSGTANYETGALNYLTQGGKSFLAYCVELQQDHAVGADGFQSYTIGQFTGNQANRLQGLFSSSYAGVDTAQEQAAFQTAIWEITHETAATLSVSPKNGSFYVKSLQGANGATNSAFSSLVNGYLSAASSYNGTPKYTVTKLSNGSYQDLVTVSAVPEPSSYAMLAAGLVAVGFMSRRRQQR
ncbi:PEP-CTERM sorting domain-containing protein [Paucibacter soli]|uniref:PEP-CTERM sorting domain-containing protein n=1 Tax=Paucibacter soli TaxID=3133433 RepID=UPI00309E6D2D